MTHTGKVKEVKVGLEDKGDVAKKLKGGGFEFADTDEFETWSTSLRMWSGETKDVNEEELTVAEVVAIAVESLEDKGYEED